MVLVVVDTLRPDRLSCYGYPAHETPGIDALAARGVRFTNAHAVASWTVPSMGAMLTSHYPRQLGLIEAPAPADTTFACRITSYNVCYTKLLRVDSDEKQQDPTGSPQCCQ